MSDDEQITASPSDQGDAPFVLVVARKPLSINARGKDKYQEALSEAARANFANSPLVGPVYARIIWFHRDKPLGRDGDADNISKPILDALGGIVYEDDLQVVKRLVHKVHTSVKYELDGREPPPNGLAELSRLLSESPPNIIYMEVGPSRSRIVNLGPVEEAI